MIPVRAIRPAMNYRRFVDSAPEGVTFPASLWTGDA